MTDFTRLTVVGATRKAEMVIPADESLGGLIPRLMDLLGEPTGSVARPLTLVRSTGEQLDIALTAAEQQVGDGELLRLVRADDAPPPPEVADVTDVLAETHAERPGLWSAASREVTASVAIGGFGFTAVALAPLAGPSRLVVLVVVAVAALVLGRLRSTWAAVAVTAFGLGAVLPSAATVVGSVTGPAPVTGALDPSVLLPAGVAAVALVLGWALVAVGIGGGLGRRAALGGGIVGAGLAAVPLVLVGFGTDVLGAVAVTGALAVIGCGLLPWFAMSASGLTGLDDQVVEGQPRRRNEVALTVDQAYSALTWSTFAVAVPLAGTAALLLGSTNRWAIGLGVAVVVTTLLRTRSFPLAAQQVPLWLAAGTGTVLGLLRQPLVPPSVLVAGLVAAAVVAALVVAVRPANHQRARLRRAGNLLEALAVIALIPLLLGVFAIYTDLLQAF